MFRLPFAFAVVLVLAGCAGLQGAPRALSPQTLWHDHEFGPATVPAVDAKTLFALAPELQAQIETSGVRRQSVQRRVEYLMALLFGRGLNEFAYTSGHSTVAAETWQLKRGNCLSLSVLAYSIGRALDLQMQLQEVAVIPVFDRRGNVDFVGRHVNVLILDPAGLKRKDGSRSNGHVVIDFDPQIGSRYGGTSLADSAVLARYYGNLGRNTLSRMTCRAPMPHSSRPSLPIPHSLPATAILPSCIGAKGWFSLPRRCCCTRWRSMAMTIRRCGCCKV